MSRHIPNTFKILNARVQNTDNPKKARGHMPNILCPMCNEAHSNEYPRHPMEVRAHAKKVEANNKRKGEAIRGESIRVEELYSKSIRKLKRKTR